MTTYKQDEKRFEKLLYLMLKHYSESEDINESNLLSEILNEAGFSRELYDYCCYKITDF